MKNILTLTTLCCALALPASAAETNDSKPAPIDFGTFSPPKNGQFVEINIGGGLIRMAAKLTGELEPEAAQILSNLECIRINVIGLDDDNRADVTDRVATVRGQLKSQGWEQIVAVQEPNQDVGIFTKLRGEESIEGVAVTVIEGNKEAVLIHVSGNVRPEQLAAVADRLDLPPLQKIRRKLGARPGATSDPDGGNSHDQ